MFGQFSIPIYIISDLCKNVIGYFMLYFRYISVIFWGHASLNCQLKDVNLSMRDMQEEVINSNHLTLKVWAYEHDGGFLNSNIWD